MLVLLLAWADYQSVTIPANDRSLLFAIDKQTSTEKSKHPLRNREYLNHENHINIFLWIEVLLARSTHHLAIERQANLAPPRHRFSDREMG